VPLDPIAKRQRRFRYLGLLGIMLFAGLAGVCINYGLVLPAVPLLLLALGCAGVFVYF
jgi:CHASE2 domain-containing sensor protein